MWRRWLVLASLVVLQSCSTAPPTIVALLEGRELVFHIRKATFMPTIFGWREDRFAVDRLWLTDDIQTLVAWGPGRQQANACSRATTFPVTLGENRCGSVWKGKREDLQTGRLYAIRVRFRTIMPESRCPEKTGPCALDDLQSGGIMGAFFIRGTGAVVNVSPSEYPNDCGAAASAYRSVKEEWAEYCVPQVREK